MVTLIYFMEGCTPNRRILEILSDKGIYRKNCRKCGALLVIKENWLIGDARVKNNICKPCKHEKDRGYREKVKGVGKKTTPNIQRRVQRCLIGFD